jgi:hypothetical protein
VFDPYPFSFLTLIVSLEAIFLSLHLGLEIPRDDEVHGLIEKTHVDRLASVLDKRLPRSE